MLRKVVLYSILIVLGFLLGRFTAITSIDKEARTEILKQKEVQTLHSEIEALRNSEKVLMDVFTQSAEDKSKVRLKVQSALLDIAKNIDSYTPSDLQVKLVRLSGDLGLSQ